VKPSVLVAATTTADGARLTLHRRDGVWQLRVGGHGLMSTAQTRSEAALAELGCATLAAAGRPRVLIGGLGLGFTLRRVLELVPAAARVQVAELLPAVVEWNRAHLREVNGAQLDDPRVEVVVGDVGALLAAAPAGAYDAVLLDVDNGPTALVDARNARLYGDAGLRTLARALRPGGRAVFWSAAPDRGFLKRLDAAGLQAHTQRARTYAQARRAGATLIAADRTDR
jgi:spermidine synthase